MSDPRRCPSRWADDVECPRGSALDPGANHHCIGLDTPGVSPHSECACACGATIKRPVGDLNVARFEAQKSQGRASLTIDHAGRGRVSVDGVDISNSVGGGTLEFKVGHATVLRVEVPMVVAFARGEIELDDATAGVLLALGWLSPEQIEEATIRASNASRFELAEALGATDTVLPSWAALIDHVRRMSAVLDEVPVSMGGRNEG